MKRIIGLLLSVLFVFSPSIREKDTELKNNVSKLFAAYSGPTDEIGWDGLVSGTDTAEYGSVFQEADRYFPVRSGDDYYWFYLKTVIEDSSNKDNVGISKLEFYTAFEALKDTGIEDGGNINDNSVGLFVYDENNTDEKIGCVNGLACEFPDEIGSLDLGEVKNFLKNDKSFEKFKEKFGKPDITQDDGYINYYGLSAANGKKHYLSISYDNGLIYYAEVVDDFKCVEVVYSESDL